MTDFTFLHPHHLWRCSCLQSRQRGRPKDGGDLSSRPPYCSRENTTSSIHTLHSRASHCAINLAFFGNLHVSTSPIVAARSCTVADLVLTSGYVQVHDAHLIEHSTFRPAFYAIVSAVISATARRTGLSAGLVIR